MSKDPKDLAAPVAVGSIVRNGEVLYAYEGGITKREVFAGQVLAAYLSNPGSGMYFEQDLITRAVKTADALLAELEKKPE
jgi:hypothetical protein